MDSPVFLFFTRDSNLGVGRQVNQVDLTLAELCSQAGQPTGIDLRRAIIFTTLQKLAGIFHSLRQASRLLFLRGAHSNLEDFDHMVAMILVIRVCLVQLRLLVDERIQDRLEQAGDF